MSDLPPEAAAYVDALEELAGVPITLVSVGPGADPDHRPDRARGLGARRRGAAAAAGA